MPLDLIHTCLPLTREVARPKGAPEGEITLNEKPRHNAKQGENLRNDSTRLRGKGDSDFPLYPLNNP